MIVDRATLERVERLLAESDLRDLIAAELRHNDECGPGPVSESEYRDDAEAILRIVHNHLRGLLAEGEESPEPCAFGPDGCDPGGGESVRCDVCGQRACDFHGDYADEEAYARGDWRCPDHLEVARDASR